ncbi:MAG: hypothetical protein M3M87_04305 [Thermoproteota archaeon]|nr:hypothetical protein [Thermoproteota archaeon]
MLERESTTDTTTKESASTIKTLNSSVKQEELIVERRPTSRLLLTTPEGPVESKTDMKVHPSNEEIRVIEGPYVRWRNWCKEKSQYGNYNYRGLRYKLRRS